ncbi:DUF1697 domain-containing protein [Aquirufa sp. Wall-65K1]
MATYITLLRGINVSGQKMIKMLDLKAMLESLGLQAVQTYIQSGNVVFQDERYSTSELVGQIQSKLFETFGFEVDVQVFSASAWKRIVSNNPFIGQEMDESQLYVSLLASEPMVENIEKLASFIFQEERYQLIDQTLYLYVPNGYGKAKLNNNFLESKLKVPITTRNWRTMLALANMI